MDLQPAPLGILVPEFPTQTHAFFWREVRAVEELGVPVDLLSSRKPVPDDCRHEFAADARKRTTYLYPPRLGAFLELLTRPMATLSAIGYVFGLRESGWRQRLKNLGIIPCAAGLVRHARRTGCRHVHVHSCADSAHLVAVSEILGGPSYSLTLHGDLPVYGVDHKSKMKRAAFIFCDARPHRDQILERVGFPADRVHAVHMGVEVDRYVPLPERAGVPGRLHLVTVARLNPTKGHQYALRAVRSAVDAGVDIRYSLAGEGEARADIEAEVRRLDLADRVTLLGSLAEDRVRQLLRDAEAFVLPSYGLGEAAPVAVMEAMAAGLPVVATRIGGVPDMITDDTDGLLVPMEDADALAAAVVRMGRDVDLRHRLGAAARATAVARFDSRQLARRLLDAVATWGRGSPDRPRVPASV